ncbi:MAG: PKD domain-containing protein [Candidatus Marinimicrobia bacterium]|nr:PKD domain-containing protein [Candidatus Neomarinimicrobiota bacterium]
MGNIKLLVILLPLCLIAQNEQNIKLSGNYYWGEGEHSSVEQAKNMALQDMMFKIQVTVSSEVMTKEGQVNDQYSEEARSMVQASSRLSLQGVNFYTKTRRGNSVVIAYISREDYRKSIAAISTEISGMVTSLEMDEQQQNVSNLVEDYYLAYLRTFQCPEPIKFITANGQQYPNVQVFLKNKIESWLAGLTIRTGKVTIDASVPMVTIPVEIFDSNKPAGNIIARLNTEDGADMEVVDGKTRFFRYMLPSAFHEDLDVILAVSLDRIKTKGDILQLHDNFRITQDKKISLDYSDYLKIGFNIYPQVSGALLFKPVHTNLSISDLAWDFGDGESSSQQNPLHNYADKNEHVVTLIFNNNPDLAVSKRVFADGKSENITHATKAVAEEQRKWEPVFDSPVIEDLAACKSYNELARKLSSYKKRRKLIFGKAENFVKPENCYIFIVHPQSKAIVAILDKGKTGRRDLKTGDLIPDLGGHYRGMISIYTEVY